MMEQSYTAVAALYDRLNGPEIYGRFAARICRLLRQKGIEDGLVLELACGTGTLARALSLEGYEMICCDSSVEMLSVAREKCQDLPVPPVFICQDMRELDLYGTVRAAVCCLDSLNYLTDLDSLRDAIAGVSLFLEPGGIFVFDVKSKAMFRQMAGQCSVYEDDDCYCAWQYGYDGRSGLAEHLVDLFLRQEDGSYLRRQEAHYQRAYSRAQIERVLEECDLALEGVYQDLTPRRAAEEQGRLLFVARKR
jgi:ubiquinone/menaquinone biosynthesis C-methylase UbiE